MFQKQFSFILLCITASLQYPLWNTESASSLFKFQGSAPPKINNQTNNSPPNNQTLIPHKSRIKLNSPPKQTTNTNFDTQLIPSQSLIWKLRVGGQIHSIHRGFGVRIRGRHRHLVTLGQGIGCTGMATCEDCHGSEQVLCPWVKI